MISRRRLGRGGRKGVRRSKMIKEKGNRLIFEQSCYVGYF